MRMTPAIIIVGALLLLWISIAIMLGMPSIMISKQPSMDWREMTDIEKAGLKEYVGNGCSYCHSLFIRTNDWGLGAHRIAKMGDYAKQRPAILGTMRTGPDLSQEGGEHTDDWHVAHFINPRNTSPNSLMPSWEFLGMEKIDKLIAYMQYQGAKGADKRVTRQLKSRKEAISAYKKGADANVKWLHDNVPKPWRAMPNPYPATEDALKRGKKMYQVYCIGCHGPIGDGQGDAAQFLNPPPQNFTTLRRNLVNNKYIGGILYYQIMNGVTGTAMPYFKKALESEKIWDISNYVAVSFIGYTDADIEPEGIDASYESQWRNKYRPPELKEAPK